MEQYGESVSQVIDEYNNIIKGLDTEAHRQENTNRRSYGGFIRSTKGSLQEYITHSLVLIAWRELGGDRKRMDINSKKIAIPIKKDYVKNIKTKVIRKYIEENISDYIYKLSVDKQVFIDKKLVIGIECKSYTENAMIKRILIDFDLLKSEFPDMSCYLFQLESNLGGDYSGLNGTCYGSKSTHSIMSYFKCTLNIVTLLEGERKIVEPIHKHFKELKETALNRAKEILKKDLKRYLRVHKT